ncbi:MAG TPA: 3-deoxy-7-phosphoheptulonate synthase [Candidatus Deferrimicrobium sp.]|nr:3-deoxy-7-phosphoheptulonate synthase [Candidatus Deferrimicrobium sp.]
MLVVMDSNSSPDMVTHVCREIEKLGLAANPMRGTHTIAIEASGNATLVDPQCLLNHPGVKEIVQDAEPYRLVKRQSSPERTVVAVSGVEIGGKNLVVMAGPCAVESREQCFAIAERTAKAGAKIFRGGAFKPRTSPYSFQGLGENGLKVLAEVRERFGLAVVTEAMDTETLDLVADYTDIIQIGSRNMQNFSLLKRVGRKNNAVLLKRGMSATIEEFLLAAEYIMAEGNHRVILCERGVRTFAEHTRNTLDLSAVPAVKQLSHLPIIVDPSHGTGRNDLILPMSRAAVAAGADGLLIEVHHDPARALSDAAQSITPDAFDELMHQLRRIGHAVGRALP